MFVILSLAIQLPKKRSNNTGVRFAKPGTISSKYETPGAKAQNGGFCRWMAVQSQALEHLQESPIFNGKTYGFRFRFSLKPIH